MVKCGKISIFELNHRQRYNYFFSKQRNRIEKYHDRKVLTVKKFMLRYLEKKTTTRTVYFSWNDSFHLIFFTALLDKVPPVFLSFYSLGTTEYTDPGFI